MDCDRFDALTRAVAAVQSRRAVMSRFLGAALALSAMNGDIAAAKKKRRKKKRKKPTCPDNAQQLCNGVCVDLLNDKANCGACGTMCQQLEICLGGACACSGMNRVRCGNDCVDLTTDGKHCGQCRRECPADCVNGVCACTGITDCPAAAGCTCTSRFEGGSACRDSATSPTACDSDADCGLGSFCRADTGTCAPGCAAQN